MNKLILVKPSENYISEIISYRDELRIYDTHAHGDNGLYEWENDISAWVKNCRDMECLETLPSRDLVEADTFMLMHEGESQILGMINLRKSLKEGYLSEHGGHIGYGVRPTMRRKGYATAMLKLCLKEAKKIGLDKVLVCCDLDNVGSRAVIKACGGVFERLAITGSEVDERYWIQLNDKPVTVQPKEEIASNRNYLEEYYATRKEDERFTPRHGLVEFLTTMRYIEQYLSPGVRIIEIGAGTGRYSRTLADMGYKVDAVELISSNIDEFRKKITHEQDISITQANACDLTMFRDNCFDITLLLGPLYHLYTNEDKTQALSEALRVTKPGGIVFAAYCLSDASIVVGGFGRGRFNVKEFVEKGIINPNTFDTSSCPELIFELVRKEDIDKLMAPFAVERLHYVGTDMMTHWIRESVDTMDDETYALFLRYHFAVCERADMVGASHHSLDVFRKN